MRAADLDIHELLHFAPEGGVITFAGERVLLLDAVALGLLRRELIQTLGATAARAVLTRFGYAHGWRVAETLRKGFPWDSEDEWRAAGARLHTIQGIVRAEVTRSSLSSATPVAEGLWHDSYEAEQHLLHLGQADEPVCWTLTGFASGYMSCVYGKEIIAIEDRCRGKGDAVCRAVVRSKEEWGPELATHLPFYEKACLDSALTQLTDTLKKRERQLQSRRALRQVDPTMPAGLVASSPAMLRTLDLARRVAKVDSTVLITGESGAGKERIARLIHDESARTAGPFLAINCAAVPETLLESELFGHTRGAFTGASQDRAGLFEAANGGTLLLDEIGDVPPTMQVKLLRVLQEREVRRVGENRARTINVRVLAATNRDLLADVHGARFRQDLYYRLRVVEVIVPPLRERREDILPLARQLLSKAAKRFGRRAPALTPDAANVLLRYAWPGNVRELENALERAVALVRSDRIGVDDLPPEIGTAPPAGEIAGELRTLAEVERDYIAAALRASGGNRAKAAKKLGIGAATLYRKLKQERPR
ncbi:MAG: sigma-54-dependent Fis family transcriptional regulator [Acidobacteria bacterium]|nr:MAG: sigma-54-dependent Fis family transcriptional regulator [Acidobacteriota bacterium]